MKKELLNKVLLSIFVIMAAFSFTACDDDETQNGWYVSVDTDQSSANFISNLFIQTAVSNQLAIMNNDFKLTMMSESDAKKHFNAMCTELENKVNALELPVLDDTYCTLYLTHAISDPNGKAPVIASKKITFATKSE
jgi:uncharacterized lipoprotein YehR (DUF1307 family)